MILRPWIILIYACASVAAKTYTMENVCKNLVTYYRLLYQISDIEMPLYFRGSDDLNLNGNGTVVFSPNININRCSSSIMEDITFMDVVVIDTITVKFVNRPWLVVEDCEFRISLTSQPTLNGPEISVDFISIYIARIGRATSHCSYNMVQQEEIRGILSEAFAKSALAKRKTFIDKNSREFAKNMISYITIFAQYYAFRITV